MSKQFQMRARFNKNTNLKLAEYLGEVSYEELIRKRNSCVYGNIKEESSIIDLFSHLVFAEIFLYQGLKKKGIKGEYNQELLDVQFGSELKISESTFKELCDTLITIDDAIITLFDTIDSETFNQDAFEATGDDFFDMGVATLVEHSFTHSVHHRGQLSQILTELGIGDDFSRFPLFI